MKERSQHKGEIRLFLRYEENIVRTVKGDPEELLNAANQLHPNQQSTIGKANQKKKLSLS